MTELTNKIAKYTDELNTIKNNLANDFDKLSDEKIAEYENDMRRTAEFIRVLKAIKEEIYQINKANPNDLSWLWHCSTDPRNVLDYTELIEDTKVSQALNKAAGTGFRLALRRVEDLGLITMGDIDRGISDKDQKTFDEMKINAE